MMLVKAIAFAAALGLASTAVAGPGRCPDWEAGTRYPWQSDKILPRDRFAWLYLVVDRDGVLRDCRFGKNNYGDPEARVWLCKSYYDRWRGPPAGASDPDRRTLERFSLVPSYEHEIADRKARKRWFQEHPDERPECYPEPTRPDRLL